MTHDYESPLGARSFLRHPCNAKQSSKSRDFTWLFSHAFVTIVCSYFSSSSYLYTFSTTCSSSVCPHSPFICWGEPFFVLNHLLYYFSTNINFFTVHYLVARCSILPVGSISTRPSPICPRFPFYTSWGKPFFIWNHLYSTFQLTLVFLQAQTAWHQEKGNFLLKNLRQLLLLLVTIFFLISFRKFRKSPQVNQK